MLALLVALAYALELPLLETIEGLATDALFRHGRPSPPAPNARVVHADIDDSALETIGRWPWPRAVLAEALEGLDGLGARVIALDILLIDPQKPEYTATGDVVDHDARLAEVLAGLRAKTVLAVQVDEAGTTLGSLWTTPEGRRKWQAIQDVLRHDITLGHEEVVAQADLDGARAARVRGRLLGIKQVIVRRVADELVRAGRPCTEAEMRRALLPAEKDATTGEFPALRLIREAVELQRALGALERRLPDARVDHSYQEIENVLPPLPRFAEAATGVGVVNSRQDPDGQLRRVTVRWRGHGKIYPQFGLAAVAAYRGDPPEALAAPVLDLAPFRLAREDMLLSWPRIDSEQPILGLAQHVSLGRVVALGRAERDLAARGDERERITRELVLSYLADQFVPADLDDAERRPAIEAELRSEAEFRLGDAGAEETQEEIAWRRWLGLTEELERARRDVALARLELRQAIEDHLVFVGWYATGNFGDFYPTAVHERTPGVIAHSVVANAVLTGYVVRPAPRLWGALLTALLGAAAALLTAATGPRVAFLFALLLATVFVAFSTLVVFSRWNVAPAVAAPLTGLAAAWAGTVVMRVVRERREKALLRRQFGARISKQLFDFLLDHPGTVHLEGQEKEVTCFFSDLAGFTSISERLDSRQTVALLNRYMWAMNDELTRLSAYVNKFLGDGIMAVWGAFAADSRHAENAARAALACLRRLDKLNRQPEFEGLPRLSMRIGIATGVVTVGDCGAPPDLQDYTVIGDSANLAARLESANKQFGTQVLVNGRTKELLPEDLLTRPLGRIAVVGQQTATEVHELVAVRGEETPAQRDLMERTARAVTLFAEGELDAAEEAWRELAATHGPAKLADLYLDQIAALRAAPAREFDGVVRLTSK